MLLKGDELGTVECADANLFGRCFLKGPEPCLLMCSLPRGREILGAVDCFDV
jgi:hypothetical protein